MALSLVRRGGQNATFIDPNRELEDIYDRMGQLAGLAFGDLVQAAEAMPWVPSTDISETDEAYVLEVEVPGVNKDQIDVQVRDREVLVAGEITESEHGRRRRKARRTGRFEFRATLPGEVAAEKVNAQLTDGVLTVTVPKSEAVKPRKVEITG
jgi:HSP20 family protein